VATWFCGGMVGMGMKRIENRLLKIFYFQAHYCDPCHDRAGDLTIWYDWIVVCFDERWDTTRP
jgi:hypothetical protein